MMLNPDGAFDMLTPPRKITNTMARLWSASAMAHRAETRDLIDAATSMAVISRH